MGRNRVVRSEIERIPLSDGDWIEVKKKLNTGEQKRLENCGLRTPILLGGRVVSPIDWTVHDIERALIFLTDWSLDGPDDKPLDLNYDTICSLEPETFDEINEAIVQHVVAQATVRAEAKKERSRMKTAEPSPTESQGSETKSA